MAGNVIDIKGRITSLPDSSITDNDIGSEDKIRDFILYVVNKMAAEIIIEAESLQEFFALLDTSHISRSDIAEKIGKELLSKKIISDDLMPIVEFLISLIQEKDITLDEFRGILDLCYPWIEQEKPKKEIVAKVIAQFTIRHRGTLICEEMAIWKKMQKRFWSSYCKSWEDPKKDYWVDYGYKWMLPLMNPLYNPTPMLKKISMNAYGYVVLIFRMLRLNAKENRKLRNRLKRFFTKKGAIK